MKKTPKVGLRASSFGVQFHCEGLFAVRVVLFLAHAIQLVGLLKGLASTLVVVMVQLK
jgi:hypothetical protein